MKIVMLLTNGFSPDYRVKKESLSLVRLGHSVTILAWDRKRDLPKSELLEGIEVIRFGPRSSYGKGFLQVFYFLIFYLRVLFYLLTHRFDVVHCHDFDTLVIGFFAGRLKLRDVVYDAHEPVYYGFYKGWKSIFANFVSFTERILSKSVCYVIATNPWHVKKFQNMGVSRVIEIANFPPKDIFPYIQPKRDSSSFVFGTIASIRPFIGIELMIDGFRLLRKQVSDVKLIIAGPCEDYYLKKLTERAEDIDGVIFDIENNIERMRERFEKLDVVLLLYDPKNLNYHMNTSTRLYESMAARRAVIVSDVGFTAEIVRREKCGFILDNYSPEGLAKVMHLLYDNREMVWEFACMGYDAFKKRYNWEINEINLQKVYSTK